MPIKNFIINRLPRFYQLLRAISRQRWRFGTREQKFKRIYRQNPWGDSESRSGPGSNLAITINLRGQLPDLIKKLDIHSILDIPCGDFHWLSNVEWDLDSYLGGDLVDEIIQENLRHYSRNHYHFEKMDLLRDLLPQVDMIFLS